MILDARELHRVITASVRELLETARLEAQAGVVDEAQLERVIFRAAAPIVHSLSSLTDAQRGELLPDRSQGAVRISPAVRGAGRIEEKQMFDERERKLLRAFSDVVRFEIDALHDRYETLKLKEHALHRALVRKGVLTIEEWNIAVTEASAEIQLATADNTSGPVQERQAVTADLEMYWAAAQEPDGAFLQPVLRVLIKMLNLPEEGR